MALIQKTLLWDLTDKCNLQCSHCYNFDKYSGDRESINIRLESKTIINRLQGMGINHIHLLGGEPLLAPGLFDLLEEAKLNKIIVTINTNGTLLNRKMMSRLMDCEVAQLTISLDGAVECDNDSIRGNGVFQLVTANIGRATRQIKDANSKMLVQVATVITKKNILNIHKMPRLIKSFGVGILDVLYLYNAGKAVINEREIGISNGEYLKCIERLLLEGIKHDVYIQFDCKSKVLNEIAAKYHLNVNSDNKYDKCMAGKEMIFMDCYGDLFPCGPCSNSKEWKELMPGINLFDRNYEDAWTILFDFINRSMSKNIRRSIACSNCDSVNHCSFCSMCSVDYYELCNLTSSS